MRAVPTRAAGLGAFAILIVAAFAACARREPVPDAELLVISADSTFWVTAAGGRVRIRGVPMLVARVDGSFRELYVVDEDRSWFDAVFVGHRLFSRDLERGDSVELHRDTVVQRLAREYAARHPDEAPLEPDEPENENSTIRATGDLEILALHGPYLSYEHHTDVEVRDERSADHRHDYRRGVLDVRNGKAMTIADLFGRATADSVVTAGRREWRSDRDSLLTTPGLAVPRARRGLAAFDFDATSFTLGAESRAPTVRFAVPGHGQNPDIAPVELAPRRVAVPDWWAAAAAELPLESGNQEAWLHGQDTLTSTANREARTWALRLRLGAANPRAVARLSSAVERVIWLDSTVTPRARAALRRAFAEASEYEGGGQIAAARRAGVRVTLASTPSSVHLPDHAHPAARGEAHPYGSRVAARVVRADDAAGREHARPRVRRRDPRDAGQDGGGVRDTPRPDAVRHRIG
jgi:hypothetical protein